MFVDDANLYSAIETTDDQEEFHVDLFDSCDWGKDWLLEHNIQKCKYIQYGNVKYEYNYNMINKDGEIISIEEDGEEKDLGILFNKKK